MINGKYLLFKESQTNKYKVTTVMNVHKDVIGMIRWYQPFKEYIFEPEAGVIFHEGMLKDIQNYLTIQTSKQKLGIESYFEGIHNEPINDNH